MKHQMFAILLVVGCAAPAAAQTSETSLRRQESSDKLGAESAALDQAKMVQAQIVGKMRERMPLEARTTAGAPYSADAVIESTQVLADGNRINRKTTTRIYRDSEGRTRRDQLNEAGAVESTFVVDPSAGTSYVFEQRVHGPLETVTLDGPGIPGREGSFGVATFKGNVGVFKGGNEFFYENQVESKPASEDEAKAKDAAKMKIARARTEFHLAERGPDGQDVREDLGTSTIEGLPATGTRTTTTIAAGAIGNVQPIKIVSEEWFSQDLQVLMLTKHNDPRSGETVYRLLNVVRAEPDPSLFAVPADEPIGGKPGVRLREERSR
jgi:hypothetical protein